MTRIEQQNGYVLLPVVLLISLMATLAFMLNHESAQNTGIVGSLAELKQSEYVAQAGLQHTLAQIAQAGCGPYTDISSDSFSNHSYSSTITTNQVGGTITTYTVAVSDDAFIREDLPTNNYGSDAKLEVYNKWFASEERRALYRFDIAASGIPAGSLVVSAIAKIFVVTPDPYLSVRLHQITADWTEGAVTWDNIAGDHDPSSVGSIAKNPPIGQYVDVNITSLVQGWINGSVANQGIMLKPSILNNNTLSEYTSKEYSNTSQRPVLEIAISDGSLSNRGTVESTGTLASGVSRTLTRTDIPLYQSPPMNLVWQPDAASGKDTEIWDQAPNNNYGNAAETWISSTSNDTTRSLLHFSLGEIPAGARILEATLSLHRQSGSGANQPVSAHRIMNPWSEDSVTWNERESGTTWGTAGADFDTIAVATTPVGPVNQRYEWSITPLVQGWVDGSYPNYGIALTAAIAGMPGERFYTSDHADPTRYPRLTITYSCECGIACIAPQGSGNILLVVGDDVTLDPGDTKKKAIFEVWGYNINLINDDADQATFDTALADNDVAYISETIWGPTLADKLAGTDKGVVNEEEDQNSHLGLSSSGSNIVNDGMEVIDNSHYITALFPNGVLPIFSAPMEAMLVTGIPAPGLQPLGNLSGIASLALIEKDGILLGGGTTPGPRVAIPIGSNDKFNWDYLNNNGRLIVQRAIQWGTGNLSSCAGEQTLEISVIASHDDGEEPFSADQPVLGSDDLELANTSDGDQVVGMRFLNVTIPQGVAISEAYIDFTVDETTSGSTNLTINGEATDNAVEFAWTYHNIIDRPTTSATVAWDDVPPWNIVGEVQTTPDIAAAVQEIVSRGGWSSGNSLAILIRGTGRRIPESFDGLPSGAPKLKITYCPETVAPPLGPIAHWKLDDGSGGIAIDSEGGHDGTVAGNPAWSTGTLGGALDFDGIGDRVDVGPILDGGAPQISVTAWVFKRDTGDDRVISKSSSTARADHIFSLGVTGTTIRTRLRTTDNGGTSDYDGGSIPLNQWVHLAFTYDDGMLRIYMAGTETASYAVTGDMIASTLDVAIGNVNATDDRYWNGLLDDVRIYDRALSSIEIADLAAQGGGGGGSPTIVDVRVATGNDDAEEQLSNGNVGLTSSDLELISDGSNAQLVGMRFTGVAVPNGATITNAYIQFQVDETNTGATNVNIQGETSDSALQFTSSDYDISSRSKTTASIPWTPVSWTTVDEASPDQRTPDISAVVQEIVNRTGWASGNDMVILISGSGERTAESYNGDSSGAALLHIEY